MKKLKNDLIQNLDEEDKMKLAYFARLLLRQEKYHIRPTCVQSELRYFSA